MEEGLANKATASRMAVNSITAACLDAYGTEARALDNDTTRWRKLRGTPLTNVVSVEKNANTTSTAWASAHHSKLVAVLEESNILYCYACIHPVYSTFIGQQVWLAVAKFGS